MMYLLLFKINCNARQNKSAIFGLKFRDVDLDFQLLTCEREGYCDTKASVSVPTTY